MNKGLGHFDITRAVRDRRVVRLNDRRYQVVVSPQETLLGPTSLWR